LVHITVKYLDLSLWHLFYNVGAFY